MKSRFGCSACLLLLFTLNASAQGRPGTGGGLGGSRPTNPTNPNPNLGSRNPPTMPEIERPVFISGKVVLGDGGQITEPAAIETMCSGRRRIETYTDSHGNFSFELKKKSNTMAPQSAEMSDFSDSTFARTNAAFQWRDCELAAILPGFTSETLLLARLLPMLETTDIGRIRLRPLGNVEGSVLSVTSLAAPNAARKALDKAREQEKKNKLDDARQSLEKAVQIYPQYAAAWAELGRVQYLNHDASAAQHSYEQALAADPKYTKPYLGLAQLALDAQQWTRLVDLTNKLLVLNSANFPGAWFLNAVGHYNLQNFEAAEKSARDGMKADPEHRVPRLEYLLGLVLVKKHDYPQAAAHLRQFLQLSTQAGEIAEAQKQLAQIEQRSATAGIPAADQQK